MSAGTGVRHSEFNPSRAERVHLLQIWIEPKFTGVRPSYEEKAFTPAEKTGRLRLIASPDGREGSVTIHQDALVHAALLDGKDAVTHTLAPGRRAYVHVARGAVKLNGIELKGGDGVKIAGENELTFSGARQAELLVFDLP
jgi:redox-sensitive bicupin YhaK (pirin superfamily)